MSINKIITSVKLNILINIMTTGEELIEYMFSGADEIEFRKIGDAW